MMRGRYGHEDDIEGRFRRVVNMTAAQIKAWLRTDESRSVGFTYPGASESVGRQSAKKIVKILEGGAGPQDYIHMRKVAGYVARHLAQKPSGDLRYTRWRYSLMNWGHDPLKKGRL